MPKSQNPHTMQGPDLIHQIGFSFVPSRLLTTGIELDVFTKISDGKVTASAVASAAKASLRGMRMLLDSLSALGLLTKKEDAYALSSIAAKYLVRGQPEYMGRMIELGDLSEEWRQLTKAVRTGKSVRRVEEEGKAVKFFPILVSGLHIINREPAVRASDALGIGKTLKGASVIDIACGSGVWGIAVAEADITAKVTAQDFPAMLRETKKYLKRHRVEKQFNFLPGDLNNVDYGRNRFDVAILGNIAHSEGEKRSRQLFRKLFTALRPGGQIAIVDMIPNEERTGPPFPVFFALNMLLNTKDGDTYTLAQYAEWLLKAGFERVETCNIGSHSPLIIGFKVAATGKA